jgi:hypothetical protein
MADEFRMQPSSWNESVTLEGLIQGAAEFLGTHIGEMSSEDDDREAAREIIQDAREWERARIVAWLEAQVLDGLDSPNPASAVQILIDRIREGEV